MFSLTRQEQALILCIALSLVAGSVVKHYRRVWREQHPSAAASPSPSLHAKALYVVP